MKPRKKPSKLEVIGMLGLSTLKSLIASGEEIKPVETSLKGTVPYGQVEKKSEKHFYLENTVGTNYVFGTGDVIARENPRNHSGVNQTFFSATYGNISGFVWTDYDFEDGKTNAGDGFHEIDFGVDYTHQIIKPTENDPNTVPLSTTIGYASWNYPSGFLGPKGEHITHWALSYKGKPFNIDTNVIHLISPNVEDGQCFSIKGSRDFKLGQASGFKFWATPRIEAVASNHFYNDAEGLRAIVEGVDFKAEKGSFTFKLSLNHLDGIDGPDFNYGSVSVGVGF